MLFWDINRIGKYIIFLNSSKWKLSSLCIFISLWQNEWNNFSVTQQINRHFSYTILTKTILTKTHIVATDLFEWRRHEDHIHCVSEVIRTEQGGVHELSGRQT